MRRRSRRRIGGRTRQRLHRSNSCRAPTDGAESTIVHAWRPYEEETLEKYLSSKQSEDYLSLWGRGSSRRVRNFVSSFGEIEPNSNHLVQGERKFVIPEFAKDDNVDLLVMETIGRLGRHGMFIGDTAERIPDRLECSVPAVKPAGFVSPAH